MKTIFYVETDETEFFFDDSGKLLTWWSRNDASYSGEYMGPLFKALGVTVKDGEPNDKRWKKALKQVLIDCGLGDDE